MQCPSTAVSILAAAFVSLGRRFSEVGSCAPPCLYLIQCVDVAEQMINVNYRCPSNRCLRQATVDQLGVCVGERGRGRRPGRGLYSGLGMEGSPLAPGEAGIRAGR